MSLASSRAKGNYVLGVNKSIVGSPVVNPARQDLGKIEDLVLDSRAKKYDWKSVASGAQTSDLGARDI